MSPETEPSDRPDPPDLETRLKMIKKVVAEAMAGIHDDDPLLIPIRFGMIAAIADGDVVYDATKVAYTLTKTAKIP